jgi:hypothetical protein
VRRLSRVRLLPDEHVYQPYNGAETSAAQASIRSALTSRVKTELISEAGSIFEGVERHLSATILARCARRLRAAAAAPLEPQQITDTLMRVCEAWRNSAYERRRRTLEQISARSGLSLELLSESLSALLEPFERTALHRLAARAAPRQVLLGFVMPGNVVGAGLHEVAQALIAGAAVFIKSAAVEPFFFAELARTVAEADHLIGQRIAVTTFGRERTELSRALARNCDALVALGSDETIAALRAFTPNLVPFGSRVSGAFVDFESLEPTQADALAVALAQDIALFEQRGCLSPHHVFVRAREANAVRSFAALVAQALQELSRRLPTPHALSLNAGAPLRAAREEARWRKIGGEPIELWEGPGFSYTVIFDPAASFRISPAYRTVYVSAVSNEAELEQRLAPVKGKLEAFAIFDPLGYCPGLSRLLKAFGVSYLCVPGLMQSPPLDWPHDQGRLLKYLGYRDE